MCCMFFPDIIFSEPGQICPGSYCHSPASVCDVWTKTLTLAITFSPEVIGLSYCTCEILVTDLSHGTIIFDLLLKNFNLGCYFVMVAVRWASLSSDNSYLSICHTMFSNVNQHLITCQCEKIWSVVFKKSERRAKWCLLCERNIHLVIQ